MPNRLTPRENQIFNMLLSGSVPKEIAGLLSISYETVLYHQKKIYRKLEVHSINELFNKYSPDSSVSEHPVNAALPAAAAREISTKGLPHTRSLKKALLIKIAFSAAAVLCLGFALPYVYSLGEKISVPNPVVITFTDDGPLGDDGPRGWQFVIDRGLFFYHGEWRKSPYQQNKNERITAGDVYDFSCTFTSDVDIGYLEAGFFDALTGGKGGYYWTLLSNNPKVFFDIKAGVEYSASFNLLITKTASCDADIANRFILVAGPKTENNPELTFTQFEVTKH